MSYIVVYVLPADKNITCTLYIRIYRDYMTINSVELKITLNIFLIFVGLYIMFVCNLLDLYGSNLPIKLLIVLQYTCTHKNSLNC